MKFLTALVCLLPLVLRAAAPEWSQVPAILARIVPPQFPARDFVITQFGAVAGGATDASPAIRRALAACAEAGGGHVVIPAGEFLTGAIHLPSNVDLHLATNSVLKFSTDPSQYLPAVFTRFEGTECYNFSPFIYALGQTNIAVTGDGTLDGQADGSNWLAWAHTTTRAKLVQAATDNVSRGTAPLRPRRRAAPGLHRVQPL